MSEYSLKDEIIEQIFSEYEEKYFIDVGACSGILGSHTYLLEKKHGWNGICIEAHPQLFECLSENRNLCYKAAVFSTKETIEMFFTHIEDSYLVSEGTIPLNHNLGHALGGGSGLTNRWDEHHKNTIMNRNPGKGCTTLVETETLSEIMNKFDCPEYIHLLDVDVEYADYDVLIGCDWDKHRFGAILIELNNELVEDKMKKEGYSTYIQFIEDSRDRMYIDSENKALEKSVKELAKSKLAPNKEFWQIESLI